MRLWNGRWSAAIGSDSRACHAPSTIAWASAGGGLAALAAYGFSLTEYTVGASTVASKAIVEHYLGYLLVTNLRYAAIIVLAGAIYGLVAGVGLAALASVRGRRTSRLVEFGAGVAALGAVFARGFFSWLLDSPESILAFWPYSTRRLDPFYDHLQPWMIEAFTIAGVALVGALVALPLARLARRGAAAIYRAHGARRVLMLQPLAAVALLIPLPFVLGSGEPKARRHANPNVLVLMSDTLRQDRTECLRGGEPVMPSVRRLALEGTSFRSCFVPVARTTESVVTLMTGVWPQTHGVRTSWVPAHSLPVPTLTQSFARAGYETVVAGDWSGTDFTKFHMGFERAHVPVETWSLKTFVARGGHLTGLLALTLVPQRLAEWICPEIVYHPGVDASEPVRRIVMDELERVASSKRPFFIQVFTGNTHAPFTPKGVHHRRFSDPTYRGPNRYGLWARTIDDALKLQSRNMLEKDLAQLEAVYDASARTFDDDVGAYLAKLEQLGLAKDTIVCILSDHGTAFYERGSFGQGNEIVSDVSNRIPFVVHDPRRVHSVHAVDHVVREVDIMPTLLTLAGVPVPKTCEGVPLLRYIEDREADLHLDAYGETGLWIGKQSWQDADLDFGFPNIDDMAEIDDWDDGIISIEPKWLRLMIRAQHRMIRTDSWKLLFQPTRSGFRVKLYDVSQGDQGGDVAAEHPEVVRALLPKLAPFIGREPDVWHDALPPARQRTRANTAFK